MEEFADVVDDAIDTREIEKVDFIRRVPVGVYSFSVLVVDDEGEEFEKNCEVLVYDNMEETYKQFISNLEELFASYELEDKEKLATEELEKLVTEVENKYFIGQDFTLDYKREDIKDIIRYYAFKGVEPPFLKLEERDQFDLAKEAKYIFEEGLGGTDKVEYINKLWAEEKSWWKVLFNHNKRYFVRQLNKEIEKLEFPPSEDEEPEVNYDKVELKELSLSELREKAPKEWRKIHDEVYEQAQDEDGYYHSAVSDFKSKSKVHFQIDHITPRAKGGLTEVDNLQLLTRWENAQKEVQ